MKLMNILLAGLLPWGAAFSAWLLFLGSSRLQ